MELEVRGPTDLTASSTAVVPGSKSLLRRGSSPRDRRETIDADDVAAHLLSDDAKNVTGTTLYVDAGYHSMGM